MFTRIVFFGALPMIFAGLRIALAVSFIVLVAAEFVATKAGIGYLIWNSRELLQVDVMFVGIVTIGILRLISSALFQEIERKVIPWTAKLVARMERQRNAGTAVPHCGAGPMITSRPHSPACRADWRRRGGGGRRGKRR